MIRPPPRLMSEGTAAAIREEALSIAVARSLGPTNRALVATHYRCPDCMQPCSCDGDARLLPHTRCGHRRS